MKYLLPLVVLVLSGCANVSSTRMVFRNENTTLTLDMPKEVETKNLKITFHAQQGTFEITSDSWISRNTETIFAQSQREKEILESSAVLIEKTAEGVTRGAIKGLKP